MAASSRRKLLKSQLSSPQVLPYTRGCPSRTSEVDRSRPVEAIRATGAGRFQVILYGVVPQIVTPYLLFTIYRWDINVRIAAIIGLVGGGEIGLYFIPSVPD